jgi:ankyrin repeat protein
MTSSLLIDHKADACAQDHTGKTPQHYEKDNGAVMTLMKNGADTEDGSTPLMTAVSESTYNALLEHGANPQ